MGNNLGPESLLPPLGSPPSNQQVDEVLVPRERVPNPWNAIWLEHEPILEPQVSQAHKGTTDTVGDPAQLVCGRHSDLGRDRVPNLSQSNTSHTVVDIIGNTSQPREVHEGASSTGSVPGIPLGPGEKQDQTTQPENRTSHPNSQTPDEGECVHSQTIASAA